MTFSPDDHSVAVVIIHKMKIHALPKQTSEWILTDDKFAKLGIIVDMAYDSSSGMYACDMNKKSLNKLCSFITNIKQ